MVAGRVVVRAWRVVWWFACGFAWRLAFRGCGAPVAGGGDFGAAGFRARLGAARLDAVRFAVAPLGAVRLFVCWLCVRCIARSAYHASGFLSCGPFLSWLGGVRAIKGLQIGAAWCITIRLGMGCVPH